MSISAVSASAILKPPEAIEAKAPQVKAEANRTPTPPPTVLAALPPGQGTRIDQLA